MKITAVILTYNEAHRIRIALTHTLQWADEVCVVDKGSTDETRDIAESMGATVHTIPFSKQGHENVKDALSFATNDWTWGFTPGEVPTRELVEKAKALVFDNYDCIVIPHKLYSFGEHSKFSPWSISGQPRLIQRKKVVFTGIAHSPIVAQRIIAIPYSDDCHVLHQTHATASGFIASHADYAINEAINGTPEESIARAMENYTAYDQSFSVDPAIKAQWIAWKIYWLMVALHGIEAEKGKDILSEYNKRAEAMIEKLWA